MPTAPRRHVLRGALGGGAVAAVTLFGTVVAVGEVQSAEALRLIEAALPTTRFFASSALTAGVTTLALLMTLLALGLGSDYEFRDTLYQRMMQVVTLSVIAIIVSTLLLVLVTIPLREVQDLRTWYSAFYYVLAAVIGILGGLVVSTALLLGSTIRGLIDVGRRGRESELLERDGADAPDPRSR